MIIIFNWRDEDAKPSFKICSKRLKVRVLESRMKVYWNLRSKNFWNSNIKCKLKRSSNLTWNLKAKGKWHIRWNEGHQSVKFLYERNTQRQSKILRTRMISKSSLSPFYQPK